MTDLEKDIDDARDAIDLHPREFCMTIKAARHSGFYVENEEGQIVAAFTDHGDASDFIHTVMAGLPREPMLKHTPHPGSDAAVAANGKQRKGWF